MHVPLKHTSGGVALVLHMMPQLPQLLMSVGKSCGTASKMRTSRSGNSVQGMLSSWCLSLTEDDIQRSCRNTSQVAG